VGAAARNPYRWAMDGDPGKGEPQEAGMALPDAEQVRAFKAFRRPVTEADGALREPTAHGLPPHLNARFARRVYSGLEGQAYVVPGPGSVCFIATGEGIGTIQGETTTALAAAGGHGFICGAGSRKKPVTFIGILPADAQRLEVLDRAGRRIAAAPNDDDSYWLEVADPIRMFLIRPDGTEKEIPFASSVE
jgi:hypothetical protein